MQPRSESGQRCLQFELTTNPRARIHAYRDHLGNVVHHFDIPARHAQLRITTEATVEMSSAAALPDSHPSDHCGRRHHHPDARETRTSGR